MNKKCPKESNKLLDILVFTKNVVHHGKEQEVKVPNFIDAEEGIKLISCLHCPQKFKISQDLAFTLNANMQGKFY